eukprot:GFKZ01010420.1.p1 GENE.GFKZ01010420.1~~GFKZ01010420.1.p1  ORF type:complete len:298 (+),score=32.86 GFKZ01010420.1:289-1182(+)
MPPPTTLNSPIFHCCQTLQTLPLPEKPTAHSLLQRAANQVRPLMAKRRWSVPLLAEFYPPQPNLLGLNHNHGQKIEVRLRSPRSPTTFLPYESILGTLLHELAHIQVGPHNAQFYALLDQLKQECDQLIHRNNDGTNTFTGHGHRIGYPQLNPLPKYKARQRALNAAENRRRTNTIMNRTGSAGRRLGGDTHHIACLCDPREMALAAAERRKADDAWCGSANDDNVIEVIDLDNDHDENHTPLQPQSSSNGNEQRVNHTQRVNQTQRRQRLKASRVPVRESQAGLAAMQRAWGNGYG